MTRNINEPTDIEKLEFSMKILGRHPMSSKAGQHPEISEKLELNCCRILSKVRSQKKLGKLSTEEQIQLERVPGFRWCGK